MRRFGTLSFGHYGPLGGGRSLTAQDNLLQAIDLAVGMDELGVDVTALRVHHFARQHAAPMPLLSAMAARTSRIHVGTGVIDMRCENPLYLAEEAGALDLLSGGRLMLGISRGSPETVVRGYEHFGYRGDDERGADLAARHLDTFLRAAQGEGIAERDPQSPFGGGRGMQRIEPHSPTLRGNVWWGAGSTESAIRTGSQGMHLMSSTLLTEDRGMPFGDLQAEQLAAYRAAWMEAGHTGTPQTSVSRSIFPITTQEDALLFAGAGGSDQVGVIDGFRSTFGRTYAAEPDRLIEQLRADRAVMECDTLLLTIPSQLGVAYCVHILESFAKHVAPSLGWKPNFDGPVEGNTI